MKKFLVMVLCLTLILTCFTALFGCGGNESGDTQSGNSVSGGLYEIDEAYELGLLTADDIQHINYYMRGHGLDSNLEYVNFTPTIELGELSADIKQDIKAAIKSKFYELVASYEEYFGPVKDYIVTYCGHYGDCYVVEIFSFWSVGDSFETEVYGDVGWILNNYVQVFKYV